MKTKIILLVAAAAVATLSFTFAATDRVDNSQPTTVTAVADPTAPAGGFPLEEK